MTIKQREKTEKHLKKIRNRKLAISWAEEQIKQLPWWDFWGKLNYKIWITRQK